MYVSSFIVHKLYLFVKNKRFEFWNLFLDITWFNLLTARQIAFWVCVGSFAFGGLPTRIRSIRARISAFLLIKRKFYEKYSLNYKVIGLRYAIMTNRCCKRKLSASSNSGRLSSAELNLDTAEGARLMGRSPEAGSNPNLIPPPGPETFLIRPSLYSS